MSLRSAILLITLALACTTPVQQAAAANCPDLPKCRGCGCHGGPGYRGPAGCVSFRDLARICGPNPAKLCTYEGAPNTGLNRECTRPHPHPRNPPTS